MNIRSLFLLIITDMFVLCCHVRCFRGPDNNLQWTTSSNLVDLSASIFDSSAFEWPSQTLDGPVAPIFEYRHLLSDNVPRQEFDGAFAHCDNDTVSRVTNLNQEATARKRNKSSHRQIQEHSGLSALEVRSLSSPWLSNTGLMFTCSDGELKFGLLSERTVTEREH